MEWKLASQTVVLGVETFAVFFILHSQLSIYTALRPNADGGHTLIHKEEDFDVETKFERCNMSYGDRIWWYLSVSQL